MWQWNLHCCDRGLLFGDFPWFQAWHASDGCLRQPSEVEYGALGQNETPMGVRWNGAILPRSILPHSAILPQHAMFHFAPRIRLEKSHYVNYNIVRCSIKWYENDNTRYIIISNHMQRFYYLICQSNWCQTASKLIYQKGEITFLWDTQKVVYCKFAFDVWRWTGRRQKSNGHENRPTAGRLFFKTPGVPFCPHVPFCPDLLY